MVYLPVNAIGLPLSFLLRPGFLLLGRRERVLGESEDVLGIHGEKVQFCLVFLVCIVQQLVVDKPKFRVCDEYLDFTVKL